MNTITGTTNNADAFSALGLGTSNKDDERNKALGQADFLRLMTEQLKNQDPLKPQSNSEFMGQLAQFSTVQGIQDLNASVGGMAGSLGTDQALRAAGLVGHSALINGDQMALGPASFDSAGNPTSRQVSGVIAATGPGEVAIDITDSSGQLVRRMSVTSAGKGDVPFNWDGLSDAGAVLPAGSYGIRARIGEGQQAQTLATAVQSRIDSVTLSPQGLVLNLAGLGSAPLSQVIRIGG